MSAGLRFERIVFAALAAWAVATTGCAEGSSFVSAGPGDLKRSRGLPLEVTAADVVGRDAGAPDGRGGPGEFVSDSPESGGGQAQRGAVAAASDTSLESSNAAARDSASDDADRAIAEADILQIEGDRLYALSQYGGLSIVDIATPERPRLLGRHRASGVPFEMYLQGGVVYAMFSSWGRSVYDDASDAWTWATSSRIEALDVSNPARISEIGSFELPGQIADSRIVGDVLYAVSYEDGYCYRCDDGPSTTITSLAVGNPASIGVVDQLRYTSPDDTYGWWRRSIAVTEDRMYVAGVEWKDGANEGRSTIQVIDISDPAGTLITGATVEARGQIESRWQMDEQDGILRVISQPGVWSTDAVPVVQTFRVVSSYQVTPLGSLDVRLPRPERLRSVRFDGPRAYAITAEQKDPLFTFDLSNPARPQQLGELEMPGFIYHMEPRGDRLYALGFDNGNEEGSLHVSLFDVSDLSRPTMLARVHFGGDWSNLAEDQDRIHKAFKFDDDLGTIFVPYSAWSYRDDDRYGCGNYQSGIQLVDFTRDTLRERGVAPARGQARRAFMHRSRLFSISDAELRAYDVSNRDAPRPLASLALATNVSQAVAVGNSRVVRLISDWWTGEARLEVVPASEPDRPEPVGSLDLASLNDDPAEWCWSWGYWNARVFTSGNAVYLVRTLYDYDPDSGESSTSVDVAVIDVSNPYSPRIRGRLGLPLQRSYSWYGGTVSAGDDMVQIGSTLVFLNTSRDSETEGAPEEAWLEVVDLSNPARPERSATVPLPAGLGHTSLLTDGTNVALSRWESVPDQKDKVRFFVDRVDVGSPDAPRDLPSVNVPGSLVAIEHETGRMLTVDYHRETQDGIAYDDCYRVFGYDAEFTPASSDDTLGACVGMARTFELLQINWDRAAVIDELPIEDFRFSAVTLGDDRVFATADDYYLPFMEGDAVGIRGGHDPGVRVMAVGGMRGGELRMTVTKLERGDSSYAMGAAGKNLVMSGYDPPSISVLDTTNLGAVRFERRAELDGYVQSISVAGDHALCSLGPWGLVSVDVGP